MDAIERYARSLERRLGGDPNYASRAEHVRRMCARLGLDRAQAEYTRGLRKGRCRKRTCHSRYAIVRVTLDTRDIERVDTSATLECTLCGHTWGFAAIPDLLLRDGGMPRVLLTLILPPRRGEGRRVWYNRLGNPVYSGADAQTVREATYVQLGEAYADHRKRGETAARHREEARQRAADDWQAQRDRLAAIDAALEAADSPVA